MNEKKLGIAIIGLGGAVGTTMVAGVELLKKGLIGLEGLPLADLDTDLAKDLAKYENIVFSGWDLNDANLADAAAEHDVLSHKQFVAVEAELNNIKPWQAIADKAFLANIEGENLIENNSHRRTIEQIKSNLQEFKKSCDEVVVINLASTEKLADETDEIFASLNNFETALDENNSKISPAILYAYTALSENVPYGNFTPSVSADIPALIEFAEKNGVPIAGKDGKTGQTFIKTVLAPALKSRALKIEGWYSTNLLGNRDGLALSNEDSLAAKIKTKHSVLRNILGYEVEDHIIDIRYYKPRGDDKEAWDNIDFTGFLGQAMQLKVNFLCKDSILAAPLVIEIARCLDLAKQRKEKGVLEELGIFFKSPMTRNKDSEPENAFHKQEKLLLDWLELNLP